jgi:hypothetical protein
MGWGGSGGGSPNILNPVESKVQIRNGKYSEYLGGPISIAGPEVRYLETVGSDILRSCRV